MRDEPFVCLAEMFAAEETAIHAQWRRMHGGEYKMFGSVDDTAFVFGITTPKHKDHVVSLLRNNFNYFVRKLFPAFARM